MCLGHLVLDEIGRKRFDFILRSLTVDGRPLYFGISEHSSRNQDVFSNSKGDKCDY